MTKLKDTILVLNAGSSSIKFQIFDKENLNVLAKGLVEEIGSKPICKISGIDEAFQLPDGSNHKVAVDFILDWIKKQNKWKIDAAGHRIVHGGSDFSAPVKLNHDILTRLEEFTLLAPLHQPHNIAPVKALFESNPDLIQVGCFDTAFHAGQSKLNKSFALPKKLYAEGVKRYGFHGLSYEFVTNKLKEEFPFLYKGKVVIAHLGNGASLCAISNGKSIDTSMGMTVIDGLPMGTRTGAMDPGVVIHLIEQRGMSIKEVNQMIFKESGLKGLSGLSSDMRVLEEASKADKDAAFAIEYFIFKIAQNIAMMAVSIGGLDGLIFTAGIGEHSETVRKGVMEHLKFFPKFEMHVIPTNEELMIAQSTAKFL